MPSAPQPLSKTVLMRHPLFGDRLVRRDQLGALSSRWARVPPKRRPTRSVARPTTTTTGTTSPDKSKED